MAALLWKTKIKQEGSFNHFQVKHDASKDYVEIAQWKD